MTTRVTGSFYVQWHDGSSNGNGTFYGRASTSDNWQTFDNFELTDGGTYTFYFSVNSAITYDTYVSVVEDGGPQIGVSIPSGTSSPITVSNVKLKDKHLQFTAAKLSGDDPKVQVGWGKGTSNITVNMTWNGTAWNVSPATDLGNNQYSVDTNTQVIFSVTDSSTNEQTAVVTQLASWTSSNGQIRGHCDLATTASGSHSFTESGSSGSTIYGVNLFKPMNTSASLSVKKA